MSGSRSNEEGGRKVRLQRVLAEAGVAARKQCERLIETGHVEVNGERVEKLPIFVDPKVDDIRVDGKRIKATTRHVYLMWHKPARVLATPPIDEHETRPTVSDYVDHPTAPRLFPVGTLGFEASGLMILTSNTKAATLLTHPRSRVERIYSARVKGTPSGVARSKLTKGVQVLMPERGKAGPDGTFGRGKKKEEQPKRKSMDRGFDRNEREKDRPKMRRVRLEIRDLDPSMGGSGRVGGRRGKNSEPEDSMVGNSSIEILTTEPRDEYVAQALHLVGHPVRKLARLAIGPLKLREVGPGAWRELTRDEMKGLRVLLDELEASSGGGRGSRSGGGGKSGSGGLGASRGPGARKPRVIGRTVKGDPLKGAANAAPAKTEQQLGEDAGFDPEEFED
ncbi:MAG: pseudouridine synthase [Phycisphaerales bacterium]